VASVTAETSPGGTTINGTTGSVSSADASSTACTFSPTIDVTKQCVTAFQAVGSNVVVRVDYTGRVSNNGPVNLTNVHVDNDVNNASFSIGTLAPSASKCYTNNSTAACPSLSVTTGLTTAGPTGVASYFPSSANVFGLTLGRIEFSDTVTATGTPPVGANVTATATAHCVICPNGSCPAQ
jgi:hypothetical protein